MAITHAGAAPADRLLDTWHSLDGGDHANQHYAVDHRGGGRDRRCQRNPGCPVTGSPACAPGNPSRTATSPPFLRPTFISVIINSLEAISSTDRATA